MAYTDTELTEMAKYLAKKIFVQTNSVAHTDVATLKLAINRIDQIFALTTTQTATLRPDEVLKTAIVNEVKTVAPTFSNQDVAIALMIWTAKESGLLSIL